MTVPLISLVGVSKRYSAGEAGVQALSSVNLTVEAGEFIAIMGPSGSGKSTLMNILGLLDHPDEGAYYLNGEDVSAADDNQRSHLRNRSIGFIFQNFNLLPRASAERNVMLPLAYRKLAESERRMRAKTALDAVGLAERSHHRPNQLSGGECQRVAIARALVSDPSLILADEPTGNLDSRTGEGIMQILKKLSGVGKTIVMVTHDHTVAAKADRIVTMLDGRIV